MIKLNVNVSKNYEYLKVTELETGVQYIFNYPKDKTPADFPKIVEKFYQMSEFPKEIVIAYLEQLQKSFNDITNFNLLFKSSILLPINLTLSNDIHYDIQWMDENNQRNLFIKTVLSEKENIVFSLFGEGLTTEEIAEKLFLSPKTIQTHREAIKRKLNINKQPIFFREAVLYTQSRDTYACL